MSKGLLFIQEISSSLEWQVAALTEWLASDEGRLCEMPVGSLFRPRHVSCLVNCRLGTAWRHVWIRHCVPARCCSVACVSDLP